MDVPRGVNAHFKESVYELHKRESHGFSPSVSHRLDHEVSLQGAGRRVAGADTNDYPAGVQRTGRPDRIGRCRETMSICSWKSRRILPSATSCGASRDGRRIGADGVPGLAQALLGAAFLGSGLLLDHQRQHHGRCRTSVSSGARTYRRQPVVTQLAQFRSRPNMAREKILITGASGFVGRALCRQLEVKGHSLKRVLRKPSPHSQSPTYSSEEFIIPDLNAVVHWRAAMEDVDVVFHLAARVHVMKENHPNAASLYQEINCEGTRKLGQAAADIGVRRFIFVSTVKVHGEKNLRNQKGEPIPFSETQPPNPADPYARSKWDAEKGLHEISRRSGMEIMILRPPLVYGPGVGGNFLKLLGLLDKKVPLPLKSVHSRRSILYVGNLVDALVTTI